MPTTLYLVRHGATPANLENRFAGRSAEPLHEEGKAQVRSVGEVLRSKNIAKIVAGPLARTMQSAGILAEIVGAEVMAEPGINEIDLPHWDGLTKDEIRARFGEQYPTWLATPHLFKVDDCETIAQVQARAVAAVEKLVADHPGYSLLLVSHLIVLRSLVLYYSKQDISEFRAIKIPNGSIVRLVAGADGIRTV